MRQNPCGAAIQKQTGCQKKEAKRPSAPPPRLHAEDCKAMRKGREEEKRGATGGRAREDREGRALRFAGEGSVEKLKLQRETKRGGKERHTAADAPFIHHRRSSPPLLLCAWS